LDVLVLNAGISKLARIADYTVEDFDSLFATNVRGPSFLVQQLLPVLGEGSSIVAISSAVARTIVGKPGVENPSILAYASTKGALETLVKNWAAILGPSGIRVMLLLLASLTRICRTSRRQMRDAYCPYKGDCTYYSIPIGGTKSEYAVWTYEKPYEAVADIKEHLALYPSRVDAIEVIRTQPQELNMPKTTPEQNKAIVLEAFDTLFNKRDYAAAERFWSPKYVQHSAHIAPGREGLFALVRSSPDTLRYENQLIVAEGDYVIAHGRFSGNGRPAAWIAADVVRFEDGLLKEHWDVLQDEATKAESVSGLPMFGDTFPK
jgi:predicted SnoaL-like aldol condensation-catalyzing enzyme